MPVGQAVTATRRLGPLAFAAPSPAAPPAVPAAATCGGRCCSSRCFSGVGGGLVRQRGFDELHNLRLGRRGAQAGREVLLDQGPRQLRQQLQVLLVRALRSGNEEDQVRGAILGTEVDRLGQPRHRQGGLGDRRRAAVRDRDAAGDTRGGLGLPGEGVGEEAFDLGGASVGRNSACQVPDHVLGRAAQVLVELDQFGSDELCHCQSFRRAVMVTASGVVWLTAGTVEPGREAAAAPWATA